MDITAKIRAAIAYAALRARWRYDLEGDRWTRRDRLIDRCWDGFWLRVPTDDGRITRHHRHETLRAAMEAEKEIA